MSSEHTNVKLTVRAIEETHAEQQEQVDFLP